MAAFAMILVLSAMSLLWLLVSWYRRDRAMTIWALGFTLSTLGYSLLVVQGPAVIGPVLLLGNGLIVAFELSLPWGLGYFLGIPRPWKSRFWVYLGVWAVVMVTFTLVIPSYPVRACFTSLTLIVLTGEFLWLSFRQGSAVSPFLKGLLWIVGLGFQLFHVVRFFGVMGSKAPSLMADGQFTEATFLVTMVFTIFWGGVLLLADEGRLQAQIRADAAELKRLNDLKDRVLAMTSHDLRGPLGNLQLLWGELAVRIGEGDCQDIDQELLEMVGRSLGGTLSLIENLFSFAEAQKAGPRTDAVADLAVAVAKVCDHLDPLAKTKGVTLKVESPGSVKVRAVGPAVTAVVRNLVGNALKFTPAGGTVTLRIGEAGISSIEVIDTGVGMPPDLVEKVFFQSVSRESRPGTAGERGSGFGLVLVRELIAGWGGTLEARSRPGEGTQVRVTFSPAPG